LVSQRNGLHNLVVLDVFIGCDHQR
jgi:hypothetical protein